MGELDPLDKYEQIIVNREKRKAKLERRKEKLAWEKKVKTAVERIAAEVFPNGLI